MNLRAMNLVVVSLVHSYQRYVVICTEDEDAGSPGEVSAGSPEEYCGTLSMPIVRKNLPVMI
ncbi:MAG: hypothetical protein R3A45_12625 [Bdellovibrionota bacterium]